MNENDPTGLGDAAEPTGSEADSGADVQQDGDFQGDY